MPLEIQKNCPLSFFSFLENKEEIPSSEIPDMRYSVFPKFILNRGATNQEFISGNPFNFKQESDFFLHI